MEAEASDRALDFIVALEATPDPMSAEEEVAETRRAETEDRMAQAIQAAYSTSLQEAVAAEVVVELLRRRLAAPRSLRQQQQILPSQEDPPILIMVEGALEWEESAAAQEQILAAQD